MRKLNRYLLGDYLTVFGVAMLLITFAFCIGAIYKVIDIMAKGLPVGVVVRFFLYSIPYSLAYSISISALFSTLLVFGRMSSDSEISAMKSNGLSMWQIASPIILVSLLLSAICLYNSSVVYPATTFASRQLVKGVGVEDPIKLLEEGRFIREIPGFMIHVGRKHKNKVRDLIVYVIDKQSGNVSRCLRADSGVLTSDAVAQELRIDLFDVRVEVMDPDASEDSAKVRHGHVDFWPVRIPYSDIFEEKTISKKRKNMQMTELIHLVRNGDPRDVGLSEKDRRVERSRSLVEINQRICLALSPFMFVLVAIPLGITSHRKESSMGMILSLGVMFVYYIFIILSDMLDKSPHLYPWLLPWIPILCGQIAGILMIRRANG